VPRIRSIKHDIWDDDDVCEVSRPARLLYIGLITQADDDGRLSGSAKWIDSQVFPYDDDTDLAEIRECLTELARVGLITAYKAERKPYIQIRNWKKHQSIDKRWYKESKLPPPPDEDSPRPPRGRDEDSPQPDPDRDEASTPEWSGEDGSGVDRSGDAPAGGRAAAEPTPISPFAPIVQRLDVVSVARNHPSPKVDAALAVCAEYADLDLPALVEEFAHYWIDGPGSKRSLDDVVWKWRNWLKNEREGRAKERPAPARESAGDDAARLLAEAARLRAEEAGAS
jgi:hypothetical protein